MICKKTYGKFDKSVRLVPREGSAVCRTLSTYSKSCTAIVSDVTVTLAAVLPEAAKPRRALHTFQSSEHPGGRFSHRGRGP